MSKQENLRELAARDVPAAPFEFEVFERRRALAVVRRRATFVSAAGSIAALAFVSVMALITQSPAQRQIADVLPLVESIVAEEQLPALVNLDRFDVTTELEERIAVLDAEMSTARVEAAPAEQLRQLESTRAQLNNSLQRVSYAHSLLSL